MTLEEKILQDYKEAMKAKDSLRSAALSFLRSQLMNFAIEKRQNKLQDADCINVIKRLLKQRLESIEQFKKGNRQDLVEKETKESEILKSYLPPELSAEELKKIVDKAVKDLGATSIKDMGKVMKEASSKAKGNADGKTLSEIVKAKLSASA